MKLLINKLLKERSLDIDKITLNNMKVNNKDEQSNII